MILWRNEHCHWFWMKLRIIYCNASIVINCPAQHGFRAAFYWFLQREWNSSQECWVYPYPWYLSDLEKLWLWFMCLFRGIQLLWRTLQQPEIESVYEKFTWKDPSTESETLLQEFIARIFKVKKGKICRLAWVNKWSKLLRVSWVTAFLGFS